MNPLERRKRHDVVTIPIIWVAFVLSLAVHIVALVAWLPKMSSLLAKEAGPQSQASMLAGDLAPPPIRTADATAARPRMPPAAAPPPPPPARPPPPKIARTRPAPPRTAPAVIAQDQPAPVTIDTTPAEPPVTINATPAQPPVTIDATPAQPPIAASRTAPVTPPPAQDLSSYIEARRRARGEALPPSVPGSAKAREESEIERRDRIVASNLGLERTPAFGRDATNAGGIFEIKELRYDDAQFYFFGFDKDIRRNARQLIDVRRGDNRDIRIAVVRRMIEIIRENTTGDFEWISQRSRRGFTLSARPADNAALEAFIMRDLFAEGPRP